MNKAVAVRLLAMLLLLMGLIYLRSLMGGSCSDSLVSMTGEQEIDPEWEAEQLQRARALPVVDRVNLYLDLIGRGSRLAEAELEIWLETSYHPDSMSSSQREDLEDLARRWPEPEVRRAAAAVLLRERDLPSGDRAVRILETVVRWPSPSSCSAPEAQEAYDALLLRGIRRSGLQAGEGVDHADMDQDRLAVHDGNGSELVDLLVEAVEGCLEEGVVSGRMLEIIATFRFVKAEDVLMGFLESDQGRLYFQAAEAIVLRARLHPETRETMVVRLIGVMKESPEGSAAHIAAHRALTGIAGRDLGPSVEDWERWWEGVRRRIERFERRSPPPAQ